MVRRTVFVTDKTKIFLTTSLNKECTSSLKTPFH